MTRSATSLAISQMNWQKDGMMNKKSLAGPNWMDQDPILRKQWEAGDSPLQIAEALGRSVAAVMTRAARLGLPRRFAPGRKPRSAQAASGNNVVRLPKQPLKADPNSNKQVRVCLMCTSDFYSSGPHNRICPKCKESPEYASASRLSEHSVSY